MVTSVVALRIRLFSAIEACPLRGISGNQPAPNSMVVCCNSSNSSSVTHAYKSTLPLEHVLTCTSSFRSGLSSANATEVARAGLKLSDGSWASKTNLKYSVCTPWERDSFTSVVGVHLPKVMAEPRSGRMSATTCSMTSLRSSPMRTFFPGSCKAGTQAPGVSSLLKCNLANCKRNFSSSPGFLSFNATTCTVRVKSPVA
mmetsp:Transcript_17461/g.39330  ORF Transcript_17461/g.39330 Transcript_17461/m.39330 type:complete len:200 (-) Transcript_17461:1487-2086(-)